MQTSSLRPRTLLLLAALLAGMSLGLPWHTAGPGSPGMTTSGYLTPGFCTTSYDMDGWAYSDCQPGTYTPGIYLPGSVGGVTSGYAHPARVFIAVAAATVALGVHRRSDRLLRLGFGFAAIGAVCDGIGTQSGFFVYLGAVAVLGLALHRAGAITLPRPRSMPPGGRAPRTI